MWESDDAKRDVPVNGCVVHDTKDGEYYVFVTTDHRINLTLYKLDLIMQGDIAELFDALKLSAREELLRATAS